MNNGYIKPHEASLQSNNHKVDFNRIFKGKSGDKSKTSKVGSTTGQTPRKRNTNFSSATSVKLVYLNALVIKFPQHIH